jgi:hypothetical protein
MTGNYSGNFKRDLAAASHELARQHEVERERQAHELVAHQELRRAAVAQQLSEEKIQGQRRESAIARIQEVSRYAAELLSLRHIKHDLVCNAKYKGHRKKGLWHIGSTLIKVIHYDDSQGPNASLTPSLSIYSVTGIDERSDFYRMPCATISENAGVKSASATDVPGGAKPSVPRPVDLSDVVGTGGEFFDQIYASIVEMTARATWQ